MDAQYQTCIEACDACAAACDHCSTACLQEPDCGPSSRPQSGAGSWSQRCPSPGCKGVKRACSVLSPTVTATMAFIAGSDA